MMREAIDATRLLSRPPDSSTPKGTSDIMRLRTAAVNASRSTWVVVGGVWCVVGVVMCVEGVTDVDKTGG